MSILYYLIILFGWIGFMISGYIYVQKKKRKGKKSHMVCPIGGHCSDVVDSKYGQTFGVENAGLGMLYYIGIALFYFVLMSGFSIPREALYTLGKLVTTGAFAFSAYLIGVQAFVLKKWCTWCVTSALLSTGIFVVSVFFM